MKEHQTVNEEKSAFFEVCIFHFCITGKWKPWAFQNWKNFCLKKNVKGVAYISATFILIGWKCSARTFRNYYFMAMKSILSVFWSFSQLNLRINRVMDIYNFTDQRQRVIIKLSYLFFWKKLSLQFTQSKFSRLSEGGWKAPCTVHNIQYLHILHSAPLQTVA